MLYAMYGEVHGCMERRQSGIRDTYATRRRDLNMVWLGKRARKSVYYHDAFWGNRPTVQYWGKAKICRIGFTGVACAEDETCT